MPKSCKLGLSFLQTDRLQFDPNRNITFQAHFTLEIFGILVMR